MQCIAHIIAKKSHIRIAWEGLFILWFDQTTYCRKMTKKLPVGFLSQLQFFHQFPNRRATCFVNSLFGPMILAWKLPSAKGSSYFWVAICQISKCFFYFTESTRLEVNKLSLYMCWLLCSSCSLQRIMMNGVANHCIIMDCKLSLPMSIVCNVWFQTSNCWD